MAFPPTSTYPESFDSDYTLYTVHNTAEARLAADNQPWSMEVAVTPVSGCSPELW